MGFRGQQFAFNSPAAAVAALVARARPPSLVRPCEVVGLDAAAGRLLSQEVRADRDSPAFDHSAMDGYAVCTAHLAGHAQAGSSEPAQTIVLPVDGESRIGEPPPASFADLARSAAVRIATGAPIPAGADAVVRREDVIEHTGERAGEVSSISVSPHVAARIKSGDHIRRRGECAAAGVPVLRGGEVITAASLATLAAVGVTRPEVFVQFRIAVITTGDELVEPHHTPSAFQLRNSNAPAVLGVLASHTWAEIASVSHVRDDGDLTGALDHAFHVADAVVLTGGVSVGHRDPVRHAVERAGAEIVFHGLPQRPGKPMLGAVIRRSSQQAVRMLPVLGLPGNPVSSLVTCVRIVLPVLAACAGARRTPATCFPGLIELQNPDGRTLDMWWHRLVRLAPSPDGAPQAELIDSRGSGDIVAAGMSDGFVEISPGSSSTVLPYYSWPRGTR
ncbi:MAG: molybdopterin molybdotransferase MoeA [Phycisphaerales bacterium]|nr:molybdopterin molybdotransferase MoeA [Phycisphaerales bacterium]